MADTAAGLGAGTAEQPDDFGKGDAGLFAYWQTQEKLADKEERTWIRRSRKIIRRFRDERQDVSGTRGDGKRFSLLWSNVETLLPVFYGRTPKADVERRFKDDDPVSRLAATLLERALNYSIDTYDFDGVMKNVVKDRLLPGRGVARVLYIPSYGDEIPAGDEEEEKGEAGSPASAIVANEGDNAKSTKPREREVVYEEARAAYVFWEDYREGPARVWAEVPWVRYRSYLTRDELIARFGKEKGSKVTLDFSPSGNDKSGGESSKDMAAPPDAYKKAIVHETWDKAKLETIWWPPGTPDLILDKQSDPLKLNGFFPNPDPLLATTTTNKRIPVPDYVQYQDQATLIDDLTQRISKLIDALRAKGIYAADEKDSISRLFDSNDDAILVPVENWMRFAGKGGLEKVIEWVPIKQIAETLVQLYEARDKELQVVYQITGISDILRGETSPVETMGAQQLKSNFATRRITPKQKDVAKIARDLIRLKADIISTHFSPKTISMITGYPQLKPVPPMPQMPQPAAQPIGATTSPPGAAAQAPPGTPPSGGQGAAVTPPGAPPQPDPAMVQYMQAMQQVQSVIQENQKLTQEFEAAVQMLRRDAMHDFRIDIEADSTIAPDEMAEKMARVEFLQQMVPMLEQTVPIAQGNPPLASLIKEIVLFAMRGFRVARSLEETFETAFDQLAGMPPHPNAAGKGKGAAQQDPKVQMAELEQKATAAAQKNAIDQQKVTGQLQIEAEKAAGTHQFQQGRLAIEGAKVQSTHQLREMEMAHMAATAGKELQ